jgi:hypothetical protein
MSSYDGLSPFRTVRQAYDHLEETGAIGRDPAQMEVVAALDHLIEELSDKRLAAKKSALGWLFARKRPVHEHVRGLYIHGEVGRGKTMLMDLFFELVPVRRKRRAHFNDFMADVHDRIQKHREKLKRGEVKEADPIPPVAKALAEEAWVLCFDEFTVTDIADAAVLGPVRRGRRAGRHLQRRPARPLSRRAESRPVRAVHRHPRAQCKGAEPRRPDRPPPPPSRADAGLYHPARARRRCADGRGLGRCRRRPHHP